MKEAVTLIVPTFVREHTHAEKQADTVKNCHRKSSSSTSTSLKGARKDHVLTDLKFKFTISAVEHSN